MTNMTDSQQLLRGLSVPQLRGLIALGKRHGSLRATTAQGLSQRGLIGIQKLRQPDGKIVDWCELTAKDAMTAYADVLAERREALEISA